MILNGKRAVAAALVGIAFLSSGCGDTDGSAEATGDTESSEIRTTTLGKLNAVQFGDETVGRPSRVFRAVRALHLDDAEPWNGMPRCMGQSLSLLAEDGTQAGIVRVCGSAMDGASQEAFVADTRTEAISVYRVHADLDAVARVFAEERVLWDHIWGANRVTVSTFGDDPVELEGRDFSRAFVAIRPLQAVTLDPPIAKCIPDWTFEVKRGDDTIVTGTMQCGGEPTSEEQAVLYGADGEMIGGIIVDGARLAELYRSHTDAN